MQSFNDQIFKKTSIGISRISYIDSVVQECNNSFAVQMGYKSKENIIGKELSNEVIFSQVSFYEGFFELFQNDILENYELNITHSNGKFIYLLVFAFLNREEGYLDLMTVDVTKQKEAEVSYKEKSDFLALINHEIRTPLATIIGFSELLAAKINDEKFKKYIHEIETASKNLLIQMNDMLDFAKIDTAKNENKNR